MKSGPSSAISIVPPMKLSRAMCRVDTVVGSGGIDDSPHHDEWPVNAVGHRRSRPVRQEPRLHRGASPGTFGQGRLGVRRLHPFRLRKYRGRPTLWGQAPCHTIGRPPPSCNSRQSRSRRRNNRAIRADLGSVLLTVSSRGEADESTNWSTPTASRTMATADECPEMIQTGAELAAEDGATRGSSSMSAGSVSSCSLSSGPRRRTGGGASGACDRAAGRSAKLARSLAGQLGERDDLKRPESGPLLAYSPLARLGQDRSRAERFGGDFIGQRDHRDSGASSSPSSGAASSAAIRSS